MGLKILKPADGGGRGAVRVDSQVRYRGWLECRRGHKEEEPDHLPCLRVGDDKDETEP